MRLIIFDIDGTLVTGPGTEKRFFLYLLRSGNQGPRQLLAFLAFLLRWCFRYRRHIFKKNKAYLIGLREEKARALASAWADLVLDRAWFQPCVDRLRQHQAEGDEVILLSGAPDFVAEAVARKLGVNRAIGSRCDVRHGRFGTRPPKLHPFADAKVRIVRRVCQEYGVRPEHVVAYADSIHDLALLKIVGTPIAVRPDERLAGIAAAEGWEILGERKQWALDAARMIFNS